MGHVLDITEPFATATAGAIEDRQMFQLQMGSALNGHSTANIVIGQLGILFCGTKCLKHVKIGIVKLLFGEAQCCTEIFAQNPLVEGKTDIKDGFQLRLNDFNLVVMKTTAFEPLPID